MKFFTAFLLTVSLVLFGFDFPVANQPETLFMNGLVVQPVLENSDLPNFRYTRTVKFYYKDLMKNPIVLENGDLMTSYCSDGSLVEIVLPGDTVRVVSRSRLSCEILAVVKFDDQQVSLLKRKPATEIRITNLTTENTMSYPLVDSHYFNRALVQ
jgi:hypothetical protein